MTFAPIEKMWERTKIAKQDSDSLMFLSLMYTGEAVTKIVVAGLVAAIEDEKERHRYRLLHTLVRADSLGGWVQALNDILYGPASQYLSSEARNEQQELTQRLGKNSWQYEANKLLYDCRKILDKNCDMLPTKTDGRNWFNQFVTLRNRTRGHGAITGSTCSKICRKLEQSIRQITENHTLFKRPWVYLHQNMSGKYRVTKISHESTPFDYLRSTSNEKFNNGVYVYLDNPCIVDLIESEPDVRDFFFPNGNFGPKKFDLISYITDDISYGKPDQYLRPPTELPPSETQGIGTLDIRGELFSNLPPGPEGYISRVSLEKELKTVILDDRHPVITLVGRGGIGKTWLSLHVLDEITTARKFYCILWFSARDIDLLLEGPKIVRPHVLTLPDIANEFVDLINPKEAPLRTSEKIELFQKALMENDIGPILFVFDNFETVQNPNELYTWLDTYIRLPNKILITTRVRDSKGDYPVEVIGMTDQEFNELVTSAARNLGIEKLLTGSYKRSLYDESAGHPYVVKILLGELAKNPKSLNVKRIVATRKDILEALFERTFSSLSSAAQRVFLTLCDWRSMIPQLALEAVLLRPEHEERINVEGAIEELRQASLIEVSTEDGNGFIGMPLVAFQFGVGKLEVSPIKALIQADTKILQLFGAGQRVDMKHGIKPRIHRVFDHVARKTSQNRNELDRYFPVLEFIAKEYPPAWLLFASLYEELDEYNEAKNTLRRFLETHPDEDDRRFAWGRLASLCQRTQDWGGEIQAMIEMSRLPKTPFHMISRTANRLNELFRQEHKLFDTQEKQIVVQTLVDTMSNRSSEANATDFSRLAWLCLHLKNEEKTIYFTKKGLELDCKNEYCQGLKTRLRF